MIETVVLGTVKTAIKKSIKSLIGEQAFKTVTKASDLANIEKLLTNKLDNVTAQLFNRAKYKGEQEIYKLLKNKVGIDEKPLKTIVKNINQTYNMKEMAKAKKVAGYVQKYMKNQGYKVPNFSSLKTLKRNIIRASNKSQKSINDSIKLALQQIRDELKDKFAETFNVYKDNVPTPIKIMKYFNPTKQYTNSQLEALNVVYEGLSSDIEYYTTGSGGEVLVVKNVYNKYTVHPMEAVKAFIKGVERDIRAILNYGQL